jgi:hypothetical protein
MAVPATASSMRISTHRRRRRARASLAARGTFAALARREGESSTTTHRPAFGIGGAMRSMERRNRSVVVRGALPRARTTADTKTINQSTPSATRKTTLRTRPPAVSQSIPGPKLLPEPSDWPDLRRRSVRLDHKMRW